MVTIYKTDGSIFAQDESCATKEELIKKIYDEGLRDFSHANLSHADLYRANFSHANFSHANFSHANFSHANFSHANLSRVDLYRADLYRADLYRADLYRVKYTYGIIKDMKVLNIYKYTSISILYDNGDEYIRLGCYERKLEEWENDFWNNEREFKNDGSEKSELRKLAFETHKKILEMWRNEK